MRHLHPHMRCILRVYYPLSQNLREYSYDETQTSTSQTPSKSTVKYKSPVAAPIAFIYNKFSGVKRNSSIFHYVVYVIGAKEGQRGPLMHGIRRIKIHNLYNREFNQNMAQFEAARLTAMTFNGEYLTFFYLFVYFALGDHHLNTFIVSTMLSFLRPRMPLYSQCTKTHTIVGRIGWPPIILYWTRVCDLISNCGDCDNMNLNWYVSEREFHSNNTKANTQRQFGHTYYGHKFSSRAFYFDIVILECTYEYIYMFPFGLNWEKKKKKKRKKKELYLYECARSASCVSVFI